MSRGQAGGRHTVSSTEPVPSLGLTGVRCSGCRQCGQGQAKPQEDTAREAAGNEVLGALGSQTEKEGVVCCGDPMGGEGWPCWC